VLNGELLREEIHELKDGSVAHVRKHELLDFGCDGIQVFKNLVYGVGLMVIRPFGVPAVVRGKKEFTKLIGIIPGPKEGVDKNMPKTFRHCEAYRRVFMAPLVSELLELGKDGIDVTDPYMSRMLGKPFEYNMKFHMLTSTGDTPMRSKIACTFNQTGHRGDQYSYWSGCNVGKKRRHLGYAKPQKQPKNSLLGDVSLGAFDKRVYKGPEGEIVRGVARDPYTTDVAMFNHAKALELYRLVESGKLPAQIAGRYCMPPFADLPLFDLCWGYALPVVHALVWGIERTFWCAIIDDDSNNKDKNEYYMPQKVRQKIQKLGESIKCPHDEGRPYTDIIVNKRMWKMENWLHFAESYCLAFHEALDEWRPWVFQAWSHLRYAIMHCMSSYGWYGDCSSCEEYSRYSLQAQEQLRKFAEICEKNQLDDVCTLNLRLMAAHLTSQELHLGPIRNWHEFWVERACQAYGKVGDASVRHPEKYIANRYLLEIACNRAISKGVRDVYSELANIKRDTGPNQDAGKPGESICLGTGSFVTFGEEDDERRSQQLARLAGKKAVKYHRASIRGQQVTAVDYSGHQSRVSYSVCVKKDPSHDEAETDEDMSDLVDGDHGDLCPSIYGNVLGFYKIDDGTDTRLLEIECYDIVTKEKDRKLGYERVDMAKKTTKLMPLETFRHKLQFFQTADMGSTAMVMNQWSLGKT